jgi:hypothetical protein
MTDEIRKLLGGYASGTLTEEERAQLYQAALDDPAVFEVMADEQPLRDLLEDSSHRAELLAAVQHRPFSMAASLRDWFERPKSKVLVALGVVALVAIGVKQMTELHEGSQPRQVAQVLRPPEPAPRVEPQQPAVPETAPVTPAPAPKRKAAAPAAASAPFRDEAPPPPPPTAARSVSAVPKPVEVLTWTVQHESGTARVRIESTEEGTLLARQGGEVLYAGAIAPGIPVAFERPISAAPVDVEFAPGVAQPGPVGVVGGVPNAAVSALRSTEMSIAATSRSTRIRIDLRQAKNP